MQCADAGQGDVSRLGRTELDAMRFPDTTQHVM